MTAHFASSRDLKFTPAYRVFIGLIVYFIETSARTASAELL